MTPEQLRDRYFELHAARADDAAFRAAVDAVDPPCTERVEGLAVSYHPTARRKSLRFVEVDRLREDTRGLYARPLADAPHLAAVFADPTELSYRNFENIVPLDRLLPHVALALRDRRTLLEGKAFTFRLEVDDATRAALDRLDDLGLYVTPVNASTRGGLRFIFHAARLAEGLTAAVREALTLEYFAHVNPVFRCNRFDAGDEPFRHHLDTPFFDRARGHLSRYTLLIYLTGGRGSPALAIDGAGELVEIPELTCVVFDQALGHEGRAYDAGRKVFLRTELIFDEPYAEAPAVAQLFSRACYLTAESVFAPELDRWAAQLYDRVAAAHWRGLVEVPESPMLEKQLAGLHFVTNGCDYWFPKRAVSLHEAAALALLDYYNVVIGERAFRARCTTSVHAPGASPAWIDDVLGPHDTPRAEPVFAELAPTTLFAPSERAGWGTNDHPCCPECDPDTFDATRNKWIIEIYEEERRRGVVAVEHAPIWFLGQELFLDRLRFHIGAGSIQILSDVVLEPLHFAACRYISNRGDTHVARDVEVNALQPLVPPILFAERSRSYHLMLDLFRNSWMARCSALTVALPRIVDEPHEGRHVEWDERELDHHPER